MSTVRTVPAKHHALGLPAGSIRAAHVLMIVGMVCLIVLMPARMREGEEIARALPIPPYLLYLLFIILGHFFGSHGVMATAPGESGPLYLPAGLVRFGIILALAGTLGWKMYQDEEGLHRQFEASMDALKTQPFLPLLLLAAFFLGISVRAIVGRESPPEVLQNLEAWISLMALVGLGVAAILHLVIAPTLERTLSMPGWESFLAAVIAFYFGERS